MYLKYTHIEHKVILYLTTDIVFIHFMVIAFSRKWQTERDGMILINQSERDRYIVLKWRRYRSVSANGQQRE